MINNNVFETLCPNLSYNLKTNIGTQTDEFKISLQNLHTPNFPSKEPLLYQDSKLYLMLLKAKNANIFIRVQKIIFSLHKNDTITKPQLLYVYENLSELLRVTSSHAVDKSEYLRALFLQKLLITTLIKLLKKIKGK